MTKIFISSLLLFSYFSTTVISAVLNQQTETQVNCTGFIKSAAPAPGPGPGAGAGGGGGGTVKWTTMQDQAIHRCLQANPYDTSMIPVLEGASFHELSLNYMFALHSLLELDNTGSLVMTVSFIFAWKDEHRVLSEQSLASPVMLVLIPVSEVWVPRFTLAQCLCD